jgi:transposase
MDKEALELLLAEGLSIERIGAHFGKKPSTVSYWIRKYQLEAVNRAKHAAKGPIDRETLAELVATGASIAEIAEKCDRSKATIKHWLAKYGLETQATVQRRTVRAARQAGHKKIERTGTYRCVLCRYARMVRTKRRVKEVLVEEAGGACILCGYKRYLGSLHFHHVDPTTKSFGISDSRVSRSLVRARAEVQKCVLLCANCHGEVEAGVAVVPAIRSLCRWCSRASAEIPRLARLLRRAAWRRPPTPRGLPPGSAQPPSSARRERSCPIETRTSAARRRKLLRRSAKTSPWPRRS